MKFWFIVLLLGSALGSACAEGLPRGYVISQHGQPASALVQTRIHSLTLKPHEHYNAQLAISAIENTTEVEFAKRKLGFDHSNIVFGGGIALPQKGVRLPHLPVSMKDLTMDQALDAVARTFGRIVINETCAQRSGKRLVSLDFVQVADL